MLLKKKQKVRKPNILRPGYTLNYLFFDYSNLWSLLENWTRMVAKICLDLRLIHQIKDKEPVVVNYQLLLCVFTSQTIE